MSAERRVAHFLAIAVFATALSANAGGLVPGSPSATAGDPGSGSRTGIVIATFNINAGSAALPGLAPCWM